MSRLFLSAALALGLHALPLAAEAAPAAPPDDPHERFLALLGETADLTWEGLATHWRLPAVAPDAKLSFDPATAAHYERVVKELNLPADGRAALAREGFVLARPPYGGTTMASALRDIFTRDLPLLVTTDAILDAVHRSYDRVLAELEQDALAPSLRDALGRAHATLLRVAKRHPALAEAAADVETYLLVARELLEPGEDAPAEREQSWGEPVPTVRRHGPTLADPATIGALLDAVDSGTLENEDHQTVLYGKPRRVDWTQFVARGHYDDSVALTRYFRAMMWLGRPDLGFQLDAPRQLRAAGLLAHVLAESGAERALDDLRAVVDLFVGGGGDFDLAGLRAVMKGERADSLAALTDDAALARVAEALDASGLGRPKIRAQVVKSELADPAHAMAPASVQVLGQRFVIDSFVLSHVVYDDIVFKGVKQLRRMPTGLDVFAVLGSDVAAQLLRPEIELWNYASNLAALRKVVATRNAAASAPSLYDLWLDALTALSTRPAGAHVPEVMKRATWDRKMLGTQLASWAQLRHDTLLYSQQSYSAAGGCIYPRAYVEPYPAFYAALARYGDVAAARLGALRPTRSGSRAALKPVVAYFRSFAKVMRTLETLAGKELRAEPFTKREELFLRHTVEGRDSGEDEYMPVITWSGWYMGLVYNHGAQDDRALEFHPTVADVHTDAHTAQVLEVGTGATDLAVVAIDNAGDRALYVGPVFTYYEFTAPASERLTDDDFAQRLWDDAPPTRPPFLALPEVRLQEPADTP